MPDAGLSIEETPHGLQVVFNGRRLYGDRPIESATRRVSSLQINPGTLIVCSSPVAWHGIRQLIGSLPDRCAILGIEAEPELLDLANSLLPTDHGNLLKLVSLNQGSVMKALYQWGPSRFRRVVEVSTSAGAMLHRKGYREIFDLLGREIASPGRTD